MTSNEQDEVISLCHCAFACHLVRIFDFNNPSMSSISSISSSMRHDRTTSRIVHFAAAAA